MIKIMYTKQRVSISKLEFTKLGDYLAEALVNWWKCIRLFSLKSVFYLGSFKGNSGWMAKFRTVSGEAGGKDFGLLAMEPTFDLVLPLSVTSFMRVQTPGCNGFK